MIKNILLTIASLVFTFGFGQIPTLAIHKDDKKTNLPIHKLSIQVDVVGNISRTTFDITFYNPYEKVLEGDFSFPLNEGQDVCRYALDVNGSLREGVVIEKIKARQVYEAVVRKNIDPGILSKTKGNFYKTRIYPIPEKGYKRVVFAIEHILPVIGDELHYLLPMSMTEEVGTFSLEVNVIKSEKKPIVGSEDYSEFTFDNISEIYQLNFNREKYKPAKELDFRVPFFNKADQFVYTEMYEGQNYFYTSFKIPEFETKPKLSPKNIAIYWDSSFSGEKRNIELELGVLKKYLEKLKGEKEVCVHTFNYKEVGNKEFRITDDASMLIAYLKSISSDGATRLDNLSFAKSYDEILLFSDGISTIGNENMILPKTPIYTFSSSPGSNYSTLKYIASKTNGKYLKLSERSINDVLNKLNTSSIQYMSLGIDKEEFKDIVVAPENYETGSFTMAGISLLQDAEFTVNFGNEKGTVWSKKIKVSSNTTDRAIIPRVWAGFKIGELDMQYQKNKQIITNLGKEHGIVTRNTSFIVLDRIEDYVTHEIVPPKELQKEYYKLLERKAKEKTKDDRHIQKSNVKQLSILKDWYETVVRPKNDTEKVLRAANSNMSAAERRRMAELAETQRALQEANRRTLDQRAPNEITTPPTPPVLADIVEDDEEIEEVANNESISVDKKKRSSKTSGPKIKLLAWQPEAPYLDSLRNVSPRKTVLLYHRLKEEYKHTPSFYIEVADFFFQNKNKKQAVIVLSNLLELDLENTELLKVVARRLLDENENELAIEVYKEILELRPEEPQSHRDLALAYVQNKEYQKALNLFNHILNTKWERFGSIKEIVLNEMNMLIVQHKVNLDVSKVNKELIYEMPIDVRIVVDWSSNDNDIDLWVMDPKGEKCYYQNKLTGIGGKISTDITAGYGPEEFTLKKAPRGFYTIYVNYFSESRQSIVGPVTVYATMYTNYGRKDQMAKRIAIQLEDGKKTLQIGQLEF
ncbi:VIT domain-containing protein [uncultured Aquimarina sp.]|uniref:VIT domain-containing protein n=1 Tax=uncultured Aquimarina sp. TaxID=575652 RepID=UPI0026370956|nr:VIT domain-containing protein [uncultured Aquimarina sp.]